MRGENADMLRCKYGDIWIWREGDGKRKQKSPQKNMRTLNNINY